MVAGFSLAASVLFMRYRDLNQVWEVVTHAGFFVAPIIYPIGILPERVHALSVRVAADAGHPVFAKRPRRRPHSVAPRSRVAVAETAIVLGTGVLVYRARAPRVAEEL